MTFGVTCTPEFDIPFHLVRQAIRCLFRIIEYFMSTKCPWLIVQGDCNLHNCFTTNEVNLIAKQFCYIRSVSNLMRYFCTLLTIFFFRNISVPYWLIPRETLIIIILIIHSVLKIFNISKNWLFYPSQVSNELQFVWFTDFLHLQSISNQSLPSLLR